MIGGGRRSGRKRTINPTYAWADIDCNADSMIKSGRNCWHTAYLLDGAHLQKHTIKANYREGRKKLGTQWWQMVEPKVTPSCR